MSRGAIVAFGRAMEDPERRAKMKARLVELAVIGDSRVHVDGRGEVLKIKMPPGPYKRRRLRRFLERLASL